MKRKFTASVWQEGECHVPQAVEVDASGKGCPSTGSGRTDIEGQQGLCSETKASPVRRVCEDVFGEFQGKVVFYEDANAPTIDEWSDV